MGVGQILTEVVLFAMTLTQIPATFHLFHSNISSSPLVNLALGYSWMKKLYDRKSPKIIRLVSKKQRPIKPLSLLDCLKPFTRAISLEKSLINTNNGSLDGA